MGDKPRFGSVFFINPSSVAILERASIEARLVRLLRCRSWKIIALEKERLLGQRRQGVGEAIAEIIWRRFWA